MPHVSVEELEKSSVKITVTVPSDEVKPYLEAAAKNLSEKTEIPGFRPGKANFDAVKQRFGEMKIYEAALEDIVRKTFVKAVLDNEIETVGSPKIDVEKLAPGNDIVYTAEVARMPKALKLAEYKKPVIKANKVEVDQKDIDLALKDLQRMQTKEVRAKAGEAVGDKDKIVVSMEIKKGGVPIEGGSSPNHAIYLTEEYYLPGLKEQVLGMKEGEEKQFALSFPKDHVQKQLAGGDAEFTINLKELYHLELPKLDDEFAKSLGQKDFASLENILKENIEKEKMQEEQYRQEKELLEMLADKSKFEEIPDLLVNDEVNKMLHELEHQVVSQGLAFEEYLKSIKKSIAELKLEFAKQALIRIKVALLIKEIAKQEGIKADGKEVDAELDKLAEAQGDNKEAKQRIFSPEYREYMEGVNRNRQVIEYLRKTMVK